MRISIVKENAVDILRCCFKPNEILKTYTFDELLNISAEDLNRELRELMYVLPDNHDDTIFEYCYTKAEKCRYNENTDLRNVVTSLSHGCNLRCIMCNMPASYSPKQKEVYFAVLNKLKQQYIENIGLTADGEPFLFKNETFKYLESLSRDNCYMVSGVTNATLLTEDDIDHLNNIQINNGIKIQFAVSVDGITNETYSKIRKNDKFETVINNVKLMNKYGMLRTIHFVVQFDNLHELSMIDDFWQSNGVDPKKLTMLICDGPNNMRSRIMNTQEWKNYKLIH